MNACERCVYGTGEHAEWCAIKLALHRAVTNPMIDYGMDSEWEQRHKLQGLALRVNYLAKCTFDHGTSPEMMAIRDLCVIVQELCEVLATTPAPAAPPTDGASDR